MATMGFLLVFAIVYMMTVLHIFGPEGREGEIGLHLCGQDNSSSAEDPGEETALQDEVEV